MQNGDLDTALLLLEARADVDAADIGDDTPLLKAAFEGHVHVVGALLEARASTEVMQRDEATPLSVAASEDDEEHREIVRLLLQARADTEATNCDNETPLFVASELGNESRGVFAFASPGRPTRRKQLRSHAHAGSQYRKSRRDRTPACASYSRDRIGWCPSSCGGKVWPSGSLARTVGIPRRPGSKRPIWENGIILCL